MIANDQLKTEKASVHIETHKVLCCNIARFERTFPITSIQSKCLHTDGLWHAQVLLGELARTQSALAVIVVNANTLTVFFALLVTAISDALVARREPVVEVFASGRVSTTFLFYGRRDAHRLVVVARIDLPVKDTV